MQLQYNFTKHKIHFHSSNKTSPFLIFFNIGLIYHHLVFCSRAQGTENSGNKAAVWPKGKSSTANSGTKVAVLLGMNRCGSFPLLSATHSLFSIWKTLKRSENIPRAPALRWGEWIWLSGPSGLHRNPPHRLNISSIRVFDQIRGPEILITLWPHIIYRLLYTKMFLCNLR